MLSLLPAAAPARAQSGSAPEYAEAALSYGDWKVDVTFDTSFAEPLPDDLYYGCVDGEMQLPADVTWNDRSEAWYILKRAPDGAEDQVLAIWDSRSEIWGILKGSLGHTNDEADVMYPHLVLDDAQGELEIEVDVTPLDVSRGVLHVEICHF